METVEFKYGPRSLHLYMSSDAMFKLQALNTEKVQIEDRILENTAEGTAALFQVTAILAEAGELARRYLGYSRERIPTKAELGQILTPVELLQLRPAVIRCILMGYGGDKKQDGDDGDIDLGLLELEKKTKL